MNYFRKRIKSFTYAFAGFWEALKTGGNLQVQVLAAIAVSLAAWWLNLGRRDLAAIIICIGLVISLELVNTAIEKLCDKIMPGQDKDIKFIKDVAAAAVLVASIISVVVAVIIFEPYLVYRFL